VERRRQRQMCIRDSSKSIDLKPNSICLTYCQIPIVYTISNQKSIEILFNDDKKVHFESLMIDYDTSKQIFKRTGAIKQINVSVLASELK
jgi:hypothetical protein